MSLKDKYSFEAIKDLSADEIGKKLTNGEFSVPAEDHEKFMQFTQAEPGSEDRLKILSDLTDKPTETPDEPVEKDADSAVEDKVDPVKEEADPLKKDENPLDDAEDSADSTELLNKLDKIRQERDSHRAANRKIGNELKAKAEEAEELRKQLEEFKKANTPETVDLKAPVPPDPKEFDEGAYSEDYQEAQSKWVADMKQYTEKIGDTPPKWAMELMKRQDEIAQKAEAAYNYTTNTQQSEIEDTTEKAWDNMWTHTEELQKKLNLPTGKLTPKTINYYVLRAENAAGDDGSKPYPEAEQLEARAFLKEVPKEHINNFGKLSKLVTSYYKFEDNVPKKAYDLSDQAVIPELIKKLELNINPVVPLDSDTAGDLSKQQLKDSEFESATRANELGRSDDKLNDNLSTNERMEKFLTMSETYRMNVRKCESDPEFMAEFTALQQEASQIVNK